MIQRNPEDLYLVPQFSLLRNFGNVYSQVGQDGILAEIFKRLEVDNGFFVEFGGWDGVYLSNCRWLFEKGWSGCYIEADTKKFKELEVNYQKYPNVICINSFVDYLGSGRENAKNLRTILAEQLDDSHIESIDFVNIDIDGLDLEVALSIGFKPKVLLIEGGTDLSPFINEPFPLAHANHQHPLGYIIKCLREFGYEPVCFLQDLYAVRNDLVARVMPQAKKLTAAELYRHHFYFRGASFREQIAQLRSGSFTIKDFELEKLGYFQSMPINV